MEQSPVNVAATVGTDIADPVLNWTASDVEIINNGHTIQANVPEGNTSTLNGETYHLLQFHWHKPSENTVGADPFAMEMHFVHANAAGDLAVLGVLIDEGQANPLYDRLWAAQPAVDGHAEVSDVDFAELLPSDLATYVFAGSLTTPPCTEGVAWNLVAMPATMSADQVGAFLYEGNARPVQPINDRTIRLDNS